VKVDGTGLISCAIAGFGIFEVEPSGCITTEEHRHENTERLEQSSARRAIMLLFHCLFMVHLTML
jgi:hypothetical protein